MGKILNKSDCIQVSLDGASGKVNDIHRGSGTYSKIIETIKKLVKEGVRITINMVVTKLNYVEIPRMYYLTKDLGCDSLSVIPVAPLGRDRANKNFIPPQEKLLEIEYETLKIAESLKKGPDYFGIFGGEIFNLIPRINIPKEYFKSSRYVNRYDFNCNGGKYKAHINAEGEVYPCVFAQHPDLRAGNLFEKGFACIWENGDWKLFREVRTLINTKCAKCKYFSLCRGGCPGIAYDFFKTVDAPDPRCTL